MVETIARLVWRIICWLELTVFTLLLYVLSYLPRALLEGFYFKLFQSWSRTFVRALGVDLRVHQKNLHPLPDAIYPDCQSPLGFRGYRDTGGFSGALTGKD